MAKSLGLNVSEATIKRVSEETKRYIEIGDWKPASPYHVVALYMLCHEYCYKVPVLELYGQRFGLCAHVVKCFITRNFNGSIPDIIPFIVWTWKRENEVEEWRRENNRTEGRRLGWKLQFSETLLTDYKVSLQRKETQRKF